MSIARLRPTLTRCYQRITDRFPSIAPLYRSIAHRESNPPFRRRFAINELHQAIKREFAGKLGGVFFEAGANDGLLFSNTAYLERYCQWSGILVEAVPHKFVECVRNRPCSVVEHCALVSPDFGGECVEIRYSNLMSYAPALANIDERKQIMDGSEFLLGPEKKLSSQVFLAPARTMQDLISKHNIKKIDFMVLDLEGAEIEALRGMNFHRCRVENILIEARDFPDLRATDEFLSTFGFKRYAQLTHRDYLYRVKIGF
jgi:FkbM family methyltransferase